MYLLVILGVFVSWWLACQDAKRIRLVNIADAGFDKDLVARKGR